MDARDVEIAALRREIQRLVQLLLEAGGDPGRAYEDLSVDDDEEDYGRPFPEERV